MQGLWTFPSPCVIDLLRGGLLDVTSPVCLLISLDHTELLHSNTSLISKLRSGISGLAALLNFGI